MLANALSQESRGPGVSGSSCRKTLSAQPNLTMQAYFHGLDIDPNEAGGMAIEEPSTWGLKIMVPFVGLPDGPFFGVSKMVVAIFLPAQGTKKGPNG